MKVVARISYAAALAALLAVASSPLAAKADYFTGKWDFHGALGHPAVEQMVGLCLIAVNHHGDVAGSCTSPFGVAKAEGVTNGYNIVLRIHHIGAHAGDVTGIATLTGIWHHDGVIRGTFTDSPFPGMHGSFIGVPVH
jgi:hypothetical protein